jgi:hypothetical protein
MKLAVLAALTFLFAPACVSRPSAEASSAPLEVRFEHFLTDLEALGVRDASSAGASDVDEESPEYESPWKLTAEESAALTSSVAHFDPAYVNADLVQLARLLVFAKSLSPGELDELERCERFPGRELIVAVVLIERSRSLAAARCLLKGFVARNESDPRYVLWKTWEFCFGGHADELRRRAALGLAILDVAEGTDTTPAERDVAAKLLSVEVLDAATCAHLRASVRSSLDD